MLQPMIQKGIHVTNTSPPLDMQILAIDNLWFKLRNFNFLRDIYDKTEKSNKQTKRKHGTYVCLLNVHVIYKNPIEFVHVHFPYLTCYLIKILTPWSSAYFIKVFYGFFSPIYISKIFPREWLLIDHLIKMKKLT